MQTLNELILENLDLIKVEINFSNNKRKPEWELPFALFKKFVFLWTNAKNVEESINSAQAIGDNYFNLLTADGTWKIFNGLAVFKNNYRQIVKLDEDKRMENFLIENAPYNLIDKIKSLHLA